MSFLGSISPQNIEKSLFKIQGWQAKALVKIDTKLRKNPTNNKVQYAALRSAILDFTLSTTLTVSTVFQIGKLTCSVPAWVVGRPLAFLVGCVSKKTFNVLDSQLPTFGSIKETAQKAYRAGLGALISFIAGLGAIVGLDTTLWNIKHQHDFENVRNRPSIGDYVLRMFVKGEISI